MCHRSRTLCFNPGGNTAPLCPVQLKAGRSVGSKLPWPVPPEYLGKFCLDSMWMPLTCSLSSSFLPHAQRCSQRWFNVSLKLEGTPREDKPPFQTQHPATSFTAGVPCGRGEAEGRWGQIPVVFGGVTGSPMQIPVAERCDPPMLRAACVLSKPRP